MPPWMTSGVFFAKWTAGFGGAQFEAEWTSEPPRYLRDWLARVRLLYGVPFEHLVPDERLLPQESIRCFYVDRNWTDRLVDGALSVGKTTTLEYAQHQAAHRAVAAAIDAAEKGVRADLRAAATPGASSGAAAPTNGATPPPAAGGTAPPAPDVTGLLMRSAIVSRWPGLEVSAFRGNARLTLLRMDRLAPDILLCLFADVPTRIEITQPSEGTQFGVDAVDTSVAPSGFQLTLRQVHGAAAGTQIPNASAKAVAVPVRTGNRRVLHVAKLKDALEQALKAERISLDPGVAGGGGTLSPSEFAVQLLQGPYKQIFEGAGGPSPRRRASGGRGVRASETAAPRRGNGGRRGDGRASDGAVTVPIGELTTPLSKAELETLRPARRTGKRRGES
ncbi:MAG TPA: hypothetical protein VNA89_00665 [Gemmatimonadaceae bacterium]|nr:hypothetical protein [Gemmatimonadaceae bacterium]